eukprot:2722946-Prymnesium_polylepis.1
MNAWCARVPRTERRRPHSARAVCADRYALDRPLTWGRCRVSGPSQRAPTRREHAQGCAASSVGVRSQSRARAG